MIVRELVAVLGLDLDEQGFKKADEKFSALTNAAKALGAVLVSGVVARGLTGFVRMAAAVEENTALLGTVFADSSQDVQDWASSTAAVVGRSEFKLREFASSMGAIAAPLLGTGEATAKLSTDMAQLAVDLASVFDTADDEAMVALRSGLLGEAVPLRRFGVNILDSEVEAFAATQGKAFKSMSSAEKMHLRYQFILKQTSIFQGNANRELSSFTNSAKFLGDRLSDLGIKIGTVLLPAATRLVHWAIAGVDQFLQLAEGTKILQTALTVLGGIAAAVALKVALPFLPAIAAATALTAVVGGLIVAIEDFVGFLEGKDSLTGRFFARMGVDGDRVREMFLKLRYIAGRVWDTIIEKATPIVQKLMPSMGGAVDWLADKFAAFMDWLEPKIDAMLEIDVEAKLSKVGEFFTGVGDKVGEFVKSPMGKLLLSLLAAWAGNKVGNLLGDKVGGAVGEFIGSIGPGKHIPGAGKVSGWLGEKLGGGFGGLLGAGASAFGAYQALSGGAPSVPSARGDGPHMNQTTNIDVTVNAAPGTSEVEIGKQVARQVDEKMSRMARNTKAALLPSYAKL